MKAQQSHNAFEVGYGRIAYDDRERFRKAVCDELRIGIQAFYRRLHGYVSWTREEAHQLETIFVQFGVRATEVWGNTKKR